MNYLVAINVFTLLFLNILYMVEKVAQHHAFKHFDQDVEEVMASLLFYFIVH